MGKKKDIGKAKITAIESCMLRTLHQVQKIKVRNIIKDRKWYPGFATFSQATIYRHARKPLDRGALVDKRAFNTARPRVPKFSQATIYRHAKKPLDRGALADKGAFNTA